jgi:hypothetical protein
VRVSDGQPNKQFAFARDLRFPTHTTLQADLVENWSEASNFHRCYIQQLPLGITNVIAFDFLTITDIQEFNGHNTDQVQCLYFYKRPASLHEYTSWDLETNLSMTTRKVYMPNKTRFMNSLPQQSSCYTACSFGWWLVLICSERKVLLVGC